MSQLERTVGVGGAIALGLGSIVGTGVFVSLGLAASLNGIAMFISLFVAGFLALCNGLSTAQLAASHPVSGGTYEYGRRYVNHTMGFLAGLLFVFAKSASAAAAAIGVIAYICSSLHIEFRWWIPPLFVAAMGVFCGFGLKRTNYLNTVLVVVTFVSLAAFVFAAAPEFQVDRLLQNEPVTVFGILSTTALLFVSYTGYGRVATLGEEIIDPQRNIPRAVILTLGVSFLLYFLVSLVAVAAVGYDQYNELTLKTNAPLQGIAAGTADVWGVVVTVGAGSAMIGVVLNLLLGVSRTMFAMGRNHDLPSSLGRVEADGSPRIALAVTTLIVAVLACIDSFKMAWSISAIAVLAYYAITNLSALRLPPESRLYWRGFAWIGISGCVILSWSVDIKLLIPLLVFVITSVVIRFAVTKFRGD